MKSNGIESNGSFIKSDAVKNLAKKPAVSRAMKESLTGLYLYIIVFALGQILISGGMSERSVYFIITLIIALVAGQIAIKRNSAYPDLKAATYSAAAYLVVFAVFDYLLVNLLFEKNNLEFYKFWPNYLIYFVLIITPFIRSRWYAISSFNPKSLLTKKGRTL